MSSANGHGDGTGLPQTPTPTHLDKLLEGKPLEVQNKVLRFAFDSGMKSNDPAFRLVQYIGYLAVLTETAPEQWKELFEAFEGELKEWSFHHIEQLESAALQTQTIKELANSCQSLGTSSNALTLTSETLVEQLRSLIPALNKLTSVERGLQELNSAVRTQAQQQREISQTLSLLESELRKLKAISVRQQQPEEKRIWGLSYEEIKGWTLCSMIFGGTLLIAAVMISQILGLKSISGWVYETWERAGWANTKLERIEKKLGIPNEQQ